MLHVEVLLRDRHQHVLRLHLLKVLAHIVSANMNKITDSRCHGASVVVVLRAHVMAVLEVIVRLDCGRIEDLEAVQEVVLREVQAAGGRDDEESLVVQHYVLAEAVQELLRVVVVRRDVQHRLLVLDRHLGVM